MIRKVNKEFLDKAMTAVKLPFTRMAYLQSSTILLILILITVQQFQTSPSLEMNDIFTVLWFIGEVASSLIFSSIRHILNKNSQTGSLQSKLQIITIRKLLMKIKYIKFLNILCNFLSLLRKIKQAFQHEQLSICFYSSIAYFPLTLFFLVIINATLGVYSSILDIINNFEWEPIIEEEQTQAQIR